METYQDEIHSLIIRYRALPHDQITTNSQELFEIQRNLGALLYFLVREEIAALRAYNVALSELRKGTKSKADAEIRAGTTDEWQKYMLIHRMQEQSQEVLRAINRFIRLREKELETIRY